MFGHNKIISVIDDGQTIYRDQISGIQMPMVAVKSWVMELHRESHEYNASLKRAHHSPEGEMIIFRVNEKERPILSVQQIYWLHYKIAQQHENGSTGWKLPEGPDSHFKDIAPVMQTHIIAKSDGTPIGLMHVTRNEHEGKPLEYYLEYNGLIPEEQGKGIGRWALLEVIRDAFEKDPNAVFRLDTSIRDLNGHGEQAYNFYKKIGFQDVEESTDIKGDTQPWYEQRRGLVDENYDMLKPSIAARLLSSLHNQSDSI